MKQKFIFILTFFIFFFFISANYSHANVPVKNHKVNKSLKLNIVTLTKEVFTKYYDKNKHKKLMLQVVSETADVNLVAYSDKWLNKSTYDFIPQLVFKPGDSKTITSNSDELTISNLKLIPKKLKLINDKLNELISKNTYSTYYVKFVPTFITDAASNLSYVNYDIFISDNTKDIQPQDQKVATASADPSPPATNKKRK